MNRSILKKLLRKSKDLLNAALLKKRQQQQISRHGNSIDNSWGEREREMMAAEHTEAGSAGHIDLRKGSKGKERHLRAASPEVK